MRKEEHWNCRVLYLRYEQVLCLAEIRVGVKLEWLYREPATR